MRFILVAFSALPFILGSVFLSLGLRARRHEKQVRSVGIRTTGTVVDNQHESRAQGSTFYRPVVEFKPQNGKKVTVVGDAPVRRSYVVGSPIAVVYDPKDPQKVLVGAGAARQYTVAATVFLVFGVIAAIVIYEALQVIAR